MRTARRESGVIQPKGAFWGWRSSILNNLIPQMRSLIVARRICGAVMAFLLFLAAPARADNWQARIYSDIYPGNLVGVDKKRRTFNFFEKNSPLKLRYSYPCVTGQLPGDKWQINDLRTPEGIYFVEYKIASGLDFKEYGGIAYTLNYPNPVDRLRGKTGHGIWIHSKGFELAPTRGCVAIDLRDIAEVGPSLLPGTPVVLAEELDSAHPSDNGSLAKLRSLMGQWSDAWAARSLKMFDFYDADAYSKATEDFNAFRQNKERLFKILSFIKIYNREIHVLEGPGYWVTWSEQFYTASNLSTEGIRRLYWQKGGDGRFRIVGMEWTPRDVGMRADFLKGRLVAQAPAVSATDASSEAPLAPRLDMPEQEDRHLAKPAALAARDTAAPAPQGKVSSGLTASISALAQNLLAISDPLVPRRQPKNDGPDEFSWGKGRSLTESSPEPQKNMENSAVLPEGPARGSGDAQVGAGPDKASGTRLDNAPSSDEKAQAIDEAAVRKALAAWSDAYASRNMEISAFYDASAYNRLPAGSGVPRGASYNQAMQALKRDFKQPWLVLVSRPARIEINGAIAKSELEQMLVGPAGKRQGLGTLWWKKDGEGNPRIVGSGFQPRALGLEANYLEQISGDISEMLESWRKAWESGSIDEYMAHYTADATQQGRVGSGNIRRQKESLWSRVRPASVRISGLRLALAEKGVRADMAQAYSDSSGHADKGIKTLLLLFDGKKWLIQREDWANQNQRASAGLP